MKKIILDCKKEKEEILRMLETGHSVRYDEFIVLDPDDEILEWYDDLKMMAEDTETFFNMKVRWS